SHTGPIHPRRVAHQPASGQHGTKPLLGRRAAVPVAAEPRQRRPTLLVPRSGWVPLHPGGPPGQSSLTTTSSWVPDRVAGPAPTCQPRSVSSVANAVGVRASRPSSRTARTSRPLVALL